MKKLIVLLLFIPLVFSCSSDETNEDNTTPDEETFLYLDSNGITIKAKDNAIVGQTYILKGVAYKVVDRGILNTMVANDDNLSRICTSRVVDMNRKTSL